MCEESSNCECSTTNEAIKKAKEQFDRAREYYEELRSQASEQMEAVRETKVGDVIDRTMDCMKRHPGAWLAGIAVAGFFLGRMFYRSNKS